ncbi:MAG: hypothetical protein LBV09_02525 [Deferribacteraceae bacterium]|jgi:carbon starvation protein|nr:hypothetical protein [Deferribacteraceae bacterium]
MNILYVVAISAVVLGVAYLTYGKFLSKKVFQTDNDNPGPAVTMEDGKDFVSAKRGMLMGQHFSAIAAAGPINGPILAATMFGWLPALLWVVLGSIFVGGVHDYGSLVASVRNKAKSITDVIRIYVSRRAWILFMVFIWIALVYVLVAFTDITASAFVGNVTLESGEVVKGGAIASSSIMYLILPMIMGLLIRFGGLKEWLAALIFLPLVGVAIWAGQFIPVSLPFAEIITQQKAWGVLILIYCLVASITPMWLILQPRGAVGGYFLYAALFFAAIGIAFGGYTVNYPAFVTPPAATSFWTPMFPVLFITIACGACSGFHALISSGTTSKQLSCEVDAKPVAYGTMLLEGMVGVVSIACVMILTTNSELISKAPNFVYASALGDFMQLIGIPATFGISFGLMAFTTFVYDTLDVCTRLGRYIVQEITGLKGKTGAFISTFVTAGAPAFFIFQTSTDAAGKPIPVWRMFWNTFGASNQLLAALALIGISIWLMKTRKNTKVWLVSFIPAVFMLIMSNWALVAAVYDGFVLGKGNKVIPVVSVVLIVLSLFVAIETFTVMFRKEREGK